jgi:hypothetical protein
VSTVRYELWASGQLRAKYATLGQALLGAAWRSRKLKRYVYVHKTDGKKSSRCVAAVAADDDYPRW